MGKYLNSINGHPLPNRRKAEAIALLVPGTETFTGTPEYQPDLVCVVSNGPFEAAGYCFSEAEYAAFTEPTDDRPKTWLRVPDVEAIYEGQPRG